MSKQIIKETKTIKITISYTNPILRWILGKAEIKIEALEDKKEKE